MSKRANQSGPTSADAFDVTAEEMEEVSRIIRSQVQFGLGMWAAGFEFYNALIRQWTESRRKAIEQIMRELAVADKEPNLEKRAQMIAKVYTEQTNSALNDVLAASISAVHVGFAQSQRVLKEAMKEASRVSSEINQEMREANESRTDG